MSDTVPNFTLKPGQWSVDAMIAVPPTARSGNYSVDLKFVGRVSFADSTRIMID